MTVDDRTRLNLHRKLEAALGAEDADTLMAHLPPVTWQDVATRSDLLAQSASIRGEIAELRGEMRGEIAGQGGELRSEISRAMLSQSRWIIGFTSIWSAALLAAARFLL